MLRSWQTLQALKQEHPEARLLRQYDVIQVPSGTYAGTWRVQGVKNKANGIKLDLTPPDGTKRETELGGRQNAALSSLLRNGMIILPKSLI